MRVLFKPLEDFGKRNEIAVHSVCDSLLRLWRTLEDAEAKGFETIVLYVPSFAEANFWSSELVIPEALDENGACAMSIDIDSRLS